MVGAFFSFWGIYLAFVAAIPNHISPLGYTTAELLVPETAAGQWLHCSER